MHITFAIFSLVYPTLWLLHDKCILYMKGWLMTQDTCTVYVVIMRNVHQRLQEPRFPEGMWSGSLNLKVSSSSFKSLNTTLQHITTPLIQKEGRDKHMLG